MLSTLISRRIIFVIAGFIILYGLIAGRLVFIALSAPEQTIHRVNTAPSERLFRNPDILDRNGYLLATDIDSLSLYAEPRRIIDPDEVIEKLSSVFPEMRASEETHARLSRELGFLWLKRKITPRQQRHLHRLGIPGIGFMKETQRFYPGGATASHILGHVDIDNKGIAGIEKFINTQELSVLQKVGMTHNRALKPVYLSLDLRVQHVVRDELRRALEKYQSIAASGIVMDVHTGEILSLCSLPDYDSNAPTQALDPERMNRVSAGVFEMGSVFKIFTLAMALDSGKVSITDQFDATKPLRISGHTISDFHAKRRILSVPEIFIYSSNIGSAKIALQIGGEAQKEFLSKLGLLAPPKTELPEIAAPITPRKWTNLTAATVSFGHGLSVSPLQTAIAAAALVNGGYLIDPSFLKKEQKTPLEKKAVISPETSALMRYLFRLNVTEGSGRAADVPGYGVGGKTGTAEKVENGRYVSTKRFNSFIAAFPMDQPRYLVLVTLDEPKPEEGHHYATSGYNAAPTIGSIIKRIAPLLKVLPRANLDADTELAEVSRMIRNQTGNP